MRGLTFLGSAIAALTLAGCHINYTETWDGEEGVKAAEGEFCVFHSDCEDELKCDDNVCVPDDDDGSGGTGAGGTGAGGTGGAGAADCTDHVDCPQGSYCHEDGICVQSNTCNCDAECGEGLTCDEVLGTCVPGEDPPLTCADILAEAECVARADCEPIYAGVNCSCGAGCECQGGEPGCVCESFEFHACGEVPQ